MVGCTCVAKERCTQPNLPLPSTMKHYCALCKEEMHGCCGVVNGVKEEITYHNHCHDCDEKQFSGGKLATAPPSKKYIIFIEEVLKD